MSARSTDNFITSLKVIAQLRHERVCTRGEMIRVDRNGRGLWQSALRWLNDENRTHSLDHIDAIVQNAIDTLGARTDETDVHARIDRELENRCAASRTSRSRTRTARCRRPSWI